MIRSREFDEFGSGNSRCEVTTLFDVRISIVDAMQDERWHSDRGQHVSHIDQGVHFRQGQCGARTTTTPLIASPPLAKIGIVTNTWSDGFDSDGTAPIFFNRVIKPLSLVRLRQI